MRAPAKDAMPKLPKIVTDAPYYLVLPMPRMGMGTFRVDGHLLRVRRCPHCGLHTTIHECPLCATATTTPRPEEAPRMIRAPNSNAILDVGSVEVLMPARPARCSVHPCCSSCPLCGCHP